MPSAHDLPLHRPDPDLLSPLDPPNPHSRSFPPIEEIDEWSPEEELTQPSLADDSGLWSRPPVRVDGPQTPLPPFTREARGEANAAISLAALRSAVRVPPPKAPAPTRPSALRLVLHRIGWGGAGNA